MSNGAEDDLYKPQDCSNAEITDGPPPLKNSKRTPNSADQFWEAHQAEYEARGKRSTDQMEQVHNHNASHPVLRDELERRRSITNVSVANARVGTNLYRICSVCFKLQSDMKSKRLKSKCKDKRKYRNNTRRKDYRPRRQHKRTNYKNTRYRFMNRSCQCGTSAFFDNTDNVAGLKMCNVKLGNLSSFFKKTNLIHIASKESVTKGETTIANKSLQASGTDRSISFNEDKSRSDAGSLQYPNTTEPSVDSYHSFSSMENEPMDY